LVHRDLQQTPANEFNHLVLGDVEFFLRCGTLEDTERLFAALQDRSILVEGIVLDASHSLVQVELPDELKPNIGAFWFTFDMPLTQIPHVGEKVLIGGKYSSYSRSPFRINLTNAKLIFPPPHTAMPR